MKNLLGHDSIVLTSNTYGHVLEQRQKQTACDRPNTPRWAALNECFGCADRHVIVDAERRVPTRTVTNTTRQALDDQVTGHPAEGVRADEKAVAFRRLATRQLSDSYRLASAILGDPSEARDAVHDAFVTAWQGRFQSMFSATKFVVAGAIVALFGGFLLAGVMTTQPNDELAPAVGVSASPSSTTTRPIELPAEIPEDIESHTLDTPLGSTRWVHLSGDAESLPDVLRPIPVQGGYVSLDGPGHIYGPCPSEHNCQHLWFSPDLLEWTRRPLPIEADFEELSLTQAGGEYWLTAHDFSTYEPGSLALPSLWRSTDALEWEAVDLTGVEPPSPAAIDWRLDLGGVAASGDAIVVPLEFGVTNATSFLGLPSHPEGEDQRGEFARLERIDDGSYRVLGAYDDEHATLRFEETDAGLRVVDAATGAELKTLEGVGIDFVERWAVGDGYPPAVQQMGLVRDGRVGSVELPEPDSGTSTQAFVVSGSDGGFTALAMRADGMIQTWTSPDGGEWTLGEVLGDEPGEPAGVQGLLPADPEMGVRKPNGVVTWSFDEARQESEEWVSSDGVEWQQVPQRPQAFFVAPLGSTWVELTGGSMVFHSADSAEPTVVNVPLGLKTDTFGAGGAGIAPISGNTIAHSVYEDEESNGWQRDHWIITFDDLPASDSGLAER